MPTRASPRATPRASASRARANALDAARVGLDVDGDERAREDAFARLHAHVEDALKKNALRDGDILELIRVTTALGLEDAGPSTTASKRGAGIADAARYVLTGSSAVAMTGEMDAFQASMTGVARRALAARPSSPPATPATTTFLTRTASGGAQTAPSTPRAGDGDRTEPTPSATTNRDPRRATMSSARRSRSTSVVSNAGDEARKPKPRRKTDGETVEDRLLRQWILRQARESARMEEIRRAELKATEKKHLTGRQIQESIETMRSRGEESRKQREEARAAADAHARRLATRSVSAHIGKKTRELTAKMPDFSSRQQNFASNAAERAERRRLEAEEEKRAKELVNHSGERVPITSRAAHTHRTLEDLQAWNDRREEKIRSAKAKKEQEEIREATFAPALDQKSLRMALKKRMALNKTRVHHASSTKNDRGGDDPTRPPFTPRLVSRQRETPREVVRERLYGATKSSTKKPSTRATTNETPREHWGGYGVDDDDLDMDSEPSGFISLADVENE